MVLPLELGEYQLTVYDGSDRVPDWFGQGMCYQILPDRFCRTEIPDPTGMVGNRWVHQNWDEEPAVGIMGKTWNGNDICNRDFFGGNLKGVEEKLPYLASLGVETIYFCPIFEASENHRYGTADYSRIDPMLGTNEDFSRLCEKAHSMGIRILLDGVFNHTGWVSRYFNGDGFYTDSVGACQSEDSPYRRWFQFRHWPDQYESWWGIYSLPAVEEHDPSYRNFIFGDQDSVVRTWLRRGADGWRLDVSDEVSHVFWRRFREAVKKEKADAVIIGENWHDAYPYLRGDQYDSIMNYAFTKACLDYFARKTFDAKQMAEKLSSNLMRNMEPVNRMMLNLLDSHDTHRFYSEVGENPDRLLAALALEMVFPGAPCIYYGTEICTPGGYDPDSRRCFDWEKVHTDTDVRKKLTELTHIRSCTAITDGNVELAAENGMLCVRRKAGGEGVSLYINMTEEQRRQEHCLKADSKVLSAHRASVLPAAGDGKMTCGVCVEPEGYLIVREQREALD